MIGFDYPAGLLLFLAIPLVLLLMRVRSRPRVLAFTPYFILERLRQPELVRTMRFLVLSRRARLLLALLLLTAMTLAVSGLRLSFSRPIPRRILLVLDNAATAGRETGGTSVLDDMRREAGRLAARLDPGDLFTVLTTVPTVAVSTVHPGPDLDDLLRKLTAPWAAPPLEPLLGVVRDAAPHHTRTVVLSPRAGGWRQGLGEDAARLNVIIPADRRTHAGNAGITALRLLAGADRGSSALFLTVASQGRAGEMIDVEVSGAGVFPPRRENLRLVRGEGRLVFDNLPLAAGTLRVSIAGEDAFPADDTRQLTIPARRPVSVAVRGEGATVFDAALESGRPDFVPTGGSAEVTIFLGDPPSPPTGPALIVNPARDDRGLVFREMLQPFAPVRWHPDHPITAPLRGTTLRLGTVLAFGAPAPWEWLATVDDVPLVLASAAGGPRTVVWTFNPLERAVFLKPEFIILLRESILWLAGLNEPALSAPIDATVTAEAASITVPGPVEWQDNDRKQETRVIDLVSWLLFLALGIGLFLGLADTVGGAREPSA